MHARQRREHLCLTALCGLIVAAGRPALAARPLFPSSLYEVARGASGFELADFNNDGRTDVAVSGGRSIGELSILLADGQGGFEPDRRIGGLVASNVDSADLDRDGNTDLVVLSDYPFHRFTVLLGHGDGSFTPLPSQPVADPRPITIGDWNEDGQLDLAIGGYFDAYIFLGAGDGTFSPFQTIQPTVARQRSLLRLSRPREPLDCLDLAWLSRFDLAQDWGASPRRSSSSLTARRATVPRHAKPHGTRVHRVTGEGERSALVSPGRCRLPSTTAIHEPPGSRHGS